MLDQKKLCARAHKELQYAGQTIQRAHLLLTLMQGAMFANDAAQAHMLSEIAADMLAYAGERASTEAEYFEGAVDHD